MTPLGTSILAWLGGGVAGAAISKRHRVAGFALGAVVVGVVADKLIERPRLRSKPRFPPIWSAPEPLE
jgi:hypothetical protein